MGFARGADAFRCPMAPEWCAAGPAEGLPFLDPFSAVSTLLRRLGDLALTVGTVRRFV